jgi:hypothetical protein
MNRREFINSLIRNGLLTILGILSVFLIFKPASTEICELNFACKNCQINKNCNLEEAKKFRENNNKI